MKWRLREKFCSHANETGDALHLYAQVKLYSLDYALSWQLKETVAGRGMRSMLIRMPLLLHGRQSTRVLGDVQMKRKPTVSQVTLWLSYVDKPLKLLFKTPLSNDANTRISATCKALSRLNKQRL